ncbi:hypothetical protein [Pseudorhodoferax sp. Leaf274]|uniref:hypothetical protein n=1 Tax=Pseudorhodoferax sp. Leaf274 TaxID=1736318 RepID=UPI000702ABE1|nr:hypothetical protein [Pseudorhodoferax sp. Leaf274]KQP43934.1 hypothetical protein ASF44_28820 [Pseudorhodoferax sp. Leaf274]
MTYQQHPLSAAFPAMTVEEFEAYRDAVIPMPARIFDVLVETEWFKAMKTSQRVAYAATWCHWLARGSNQYVRRRSTQSPQYRAEVAQLAVRKAMHA